MPKKRSNPKKKGRKDIDANATVPGPRGSSIASPEASSPTQRRTAPLRTAPLRTTVPQQDSSPSPNVESHGPATFLENAKHLLYPRYKESTKRFKERVLSMVPSDLIQSDSVSELTTVANYIAVNDLEVEPELLSDLKNAIRGRKRVAMVQYGGGDARHEYCIRVLEYCWSVLSPHRKKPKVKSVSQDDLEQDESAMDAVSNLFAELRASGVDTDDDDDDLDNDSPVGSLPCPPETGHAQCTLFELVHGTDHMNIALFLQTLDDLMSRTAGQFAQLKKVSESVQQDNSPPGALVQHLMEASVASNFAIQQVVSLEKIFIQDNPHLNTIYRVFAAFVFPDIVQQLSDIVGLKSPIAAQFSKKHAIAFVSSAIECAFQDIGKPNVKVDSIVMEFQDRWQVPVGDDHGDDGFSIQDVFDHTTRMARIEARLHVAVPDELIRYGTLNPVWLPHLYIGQNRNMTHTIRLLQKTASLFSRFGVASVGLMMKSWGVVWKDCKTPASTIQFEMDGLLMQDVLPSWLIMCSKGLMSREVPYEEKLFAAFAQLKVLLRHPGSPVSWSLAFSIHSILTAVFEVQGSGHVQCIGETARQAFNKYNQQLKWVEEAQLTTISSRPALWAENVGAIINLHWLLHVSIERTEEQRFLSLWNPFCAGAFLSYIAYYGNVLTGTVALDIVFQFRMTLHLFSALTQVRAIQPGQVKILDWLLETMRGSDRMWNGPLPRAGQFRNRWKRVACRDDYDPKLYNSSYAPLPENAPIVLKTLSSSFHPICAHDFRGISSKKNKSTQLAYQKHALVKYDNQLNYMLAAMKTDKYLLGTNIICLAHYLNQFCIDLFVELGCISDINKWARENPLHRYTGIWDDYAKYERMTTLFSNMVLRSLDAGDASMSSRCAEFTKTFFSTIPADKIMWFNPVDSRHREER